MQNQTTLVTNKSLRPFQQNVSRVSIGTTRIDAIKELMQLEQHRQESIARLDSLTARVNTLQLKLLKSVRYSPAHPATTNFESQSPIKSSSHRMKRGELRDKLIEALVAAGSSGVSVKALSVALNIKAANLHSWFHSALKRYSHIRKTAPGWYQLQSDGITAPVAKRMRQDHHPVKTSKKRMRTKKGAVARKILDLLRQAGPGGLSVGTIAERIHSHYRNIHVWFSSTGKKYPHLEKIGRGIYRLNDESNTATPTSRVTAYPSDDKGTF